MPLTAKCDTCGKEVNAVEITATSYTFKVPRPWMHRGCPDCNYVIVVCSDICAQIADTEHHAKTGHTFGGKVRRAGSDTLEPLVPTPKIN